MLITSTVSLKDLYSIGRPCLFRFGRRRTRAIGATLQSGPVPQLLLQKVATNGNRTALTITQRHPATHHAFIETHPNSSRFSLESSSRLNICVLPVTFVSAALMKNVAEHPHDRSEKHVDSPNTNTKLVQFSLLLVRSRASHVPLCVCTRYSKNRVCLRLMVDG